jgi:signal transduction histidine kinase
MLHEFISAHTDEIIQRCKAKAATRSSDPALAAGIEHGVPVFLAQLVGALRVQDGSGSEISRVARLHGHDLLVQGVSASDVVHNYGDVCQTVTALAIEQATPISPGDFQTLNRCLDNAIAAAVTEYGRERNQESIAGESARGAERLGFFVHELRNLTGTALLAFEQIKSGSVGVAGSTAAVLQRSLTGISALIGRSLAEIRLTQGIQSPQPVMVASLIDDVASAGRLSAPANGITFTVFPPDEGVAVLADPQVLAAAVGNLLQNAFKFTRPGTTVTLRAIASAGRVRIEVQDGCGGLPNDGIDELFRPFERRSVNRSGLGLGLPFSRWAVEANGGRIETRNVPGEGCLFTVDLPRHDSAGRVG